MSTFAEIRTTIQFDSCSILIHFDYVWYNLLIVPAWGDCIYVFCIFRAGYLYIFGYASQLYEYSIELLLDKLEWKKIHVGMGLLAGKLSRAYMYIGNYALACMYTGQYKDEHHMQKLRGGGTALIDSNVSLKHINYSSF